jgi:hypothetical protein
VRKRCSVVRAVIVVHFVSVPVTRRAALHLFYSTLASEQERKYREKQEQEIYSKYEYCNDGHYYRPDQRTDQQAPSRSHGYPIFKS